MAEIELRPTNLHWGEGCDPFRDCCVHGGLYVRISQTVLSDGKEDDWTVSTAAFRLLRSIFHDHTIHNMEPLVPHCGFTMWLEETEPDGLYIPNCDLNINWSIFHKDDKIVHEFKDGKTCETNIADWAEAVCNLADEIYAFLHTAWPKVIEDEMDWEGFEFFMKLWKERRASAHLLYAN